MSLTSSIVFNLLGFCFIGFIVWWFWLQKSTHIVKAANQIIDVEVANGIYNPAVIEAGTNKLLTLRFWRKEENPCAATVVFPDFDVSAELPIGKPVTITLTPKKEGEFVFTCQMGMYRGKVIVK